MKRSLLSALVLSLALVAALTATVLAADEPAPGEPTPAVEPTPTDGNGEIVIDPTFITATAEPTATPRGAVQAATGRPDRTPPATDTISAETAPGTGLQVLFLVAIAGCAFALLVGRVPPARRA